ncbi:MAG: YkgJ family cysteine cluster protein [Candidatus Omnitrophota bacterium]
MTDTMAEAAKEKILGFTCRQCHACCRQEGFVYLGSGEAAAMAGWMGLDEFAFVNEYCELQDRQKLVLRKLEDEACIFLTGEGCRIHPAKPRQCRDFPSQWRTPKSRRYCEGLAALNP